MYTSDRVIFYNLEKGVYLAAITEDTERFDANAKIFTIPNKVYSYDYIGYYTCIENKKN